MRRVAHYDAEKSRLHATKQFSDFMFKAQGCEDIKVHKLLLAAHSPVLERFFKQHKSVSKGIVRIFVDFSNMSQKADLSDLFPQNINDHHTTSAIRDSMVDLTTWCYFESYSEEHYEEIPGDVAAIIFSHLLTMTLAIHLEMQALVDYCTEHFPYVFETYAYNYSRLDDNTMNYDYIKSVLKECLSTEYHDKLKLPENVFQLLTREAFKTFEDRINLYTLLKEHKEILSLMGDIPQAVAQFYNQLYSAKPKEKAYETDEDKEE